MTILVNLYGSPGTGKSTTAAGLYSELKNLGINCELVREEAKDYAWKGIEITKELQYKCMMTQFEKTLVLLARGVDVIITDSPIMLSHFYGKLEEALILNNMIDLNCSVIDVLLKRVKAYNPNGRYQTESESDEIFKGLRSATDYDMICYANKAGLSYIKWEITNALAKIAR